MEAHRKPLDLNVSITTPENIEFIYNIAGPFRRLPAFLLDILFRYIFLFILFIIMAFTGVFQLFPFSDSILVASGIVLVFLLSWFYGVFLETWMNGQTFGKRVTGLRVVSVDGRPINASQATIRNFLKIADIFPFAPLVIGEEITSIAYVVPTFLVALICMLMTKRFQRVGDLAAGTMVIVNERRWYPKRVVLDDSRIPSLCEFVPATFRMSPSLAKTVAMFVQRRSSMPPVKREEIASWLAEPLIARFKMMPDTSGDLLLCTLFYRDFLMDGPMKDLQR
jgi:uncharacterized RDD family membrane protein YckC